MPGGPFNSPGPHLVIPRFFGQDQVDRLLDFAGRREGDFRPSGVTNTSESERIDTGMRRSLRLWDVPELEPLVTTRLAGVMDRVLAALNTPPFEPARHEIELVAHGHGAFFARHVDTITGETPLADGGRRASRVISMVYYFCRTPRRFEGGRLRLHSLAATGAPGTFVDIEPENDTALFFPSWFPHEVMPVTCDGGAFMDSRFAINCWLHR